MGIIQAIDLVVNITILFSTITAISSFFALLNVLSWFMTIKCSWKRLRGFHWQPDLTQQDMESQQKQFMTHFYMLLFVLCWECLLYLTLVTAVVPDYIIGNKNSYEAKDLIILRTGIWGRVFERTWAVMVWLGVTMFAFQCYCLSMATVPFHYSNTQNNEQHKFKEWLKRFSKYVLRNFIVLVLTCVPYSGLLGIVLSIFTLIWDIINIIHIFRKAIKVLQQKILEKESQSKLVHPTSSEKKMIELELVSQKLGKSAMKIMQYLIIFIQILVLSYLIVNVVLPAILSSGIYIESSGIYHFDHYTQGTIILPPREVGIVIILLQRLLGGIISILVFIWNVYFVVVGMFAQYLMYKTFIKGGAYHFRPDNNKLYVVS